MFEWWKRRKAKKLRERLAFEDACFLFKRSGFEICENVFCMRCTFCERNTNLVIEEFEKTSPIGTRFKKIR